MVLSAISGFPDVAGVADHWCKIGSSNELPRLSSDGCEIGEDAECRAALD
jgi:hypothetical protein